MKDMWRSRLKGQAAEITYRHPIADDSDSCKFPQMRHMVLVIAPLALLVGCVGHHADPASPRHAREAKLSAPSSKEVKESYYEFRYRLVCPDEKNCDKLAWQREPYVSGAAVQECTPARKLGSVQCKFIIYQALPLEYDGAIADLPTGNIEKLYFCAGLFRKGPGKWTLLTLYEKCHPYGEAPGS